MGDFDSRRDRELAKANEAHMAAYCCIPNCKNYGTMAHNATGGGDRSSGRNWYCGDHFIANQAPPEAVGNNRNRRTAVDLAMDSRIAANREALQRLQAEHPTDWQAIVLKLAKERISKLVAATKKNPATGAGP